VKAVTYDGAGRIAKEAETAKTTCHLRSTVLGGRAVSEYDGSGVRRVTHVMAGGAPIADSWNNGGTPAVVWRHQNPVTGDELNTDSTGVVTAKVTLDPAGVNLGDSDPAEVTTSGGDDGSGIQAQINKTYAQLVPGSSGFKCALNDLYMDCGSMPGVLDDGPAPTPRQRRYGTGISNGLSMPEWAWEDLWRQGLRKFWAVVSGREGFRATPPTGWIEVPFNPFTGEMGNPNCFLNAVPGSPGIARNYVGNHDGFHARGPGNVIVLPALNGAEVKYKTSRDESKDHFNTILDIAVPGGKYVALLKDMGDVTIGKGSILEAGRKIGTVTGGLYTKDGYGAIDGLHFALIRAEYYEEYRKLTPHTVSSKDPQYKEATQMIKDNQDKWFVNPLKEGPFQCPGVTTRVDMPLVPGPKGRVPTVYPLP
jgi:hypothetical protein